MRRKKLIRICAFLLIACVGFSILASNRTATLAASDVLELRVEKKWIDTPIDQLPESITVNLFKSLNADGTEGVLVDEVNIKKANNWIANVPVNIDTDTVEQYYYYVKEQSSIAGFDVVDTTIPTKPTIIESGDTGWVNPSESLPFGSASYYNAVVFGDYNVPGADSEGGIAVQGDFTATGSYTVGLPAAANKSWWSGGWSPSYDVGKKIYPHTPRFIVGGDVSYTDAIHSVGGNVLISQNTSINSTGTGIITEWKYTGTGPYSAANPQSEFTSTQHSGTYDTLNRDTSAVDTFFSNAKSSLNTLSSTWRDATLPGNVYTADVTMPSVAGVGNELKFEMPSDYKNYDYIVYNVAAIESSISGVAPVAGESSFSNVKMAFPDDYEGKIIINLIPQAGVTKLKAYNGTIEFNGIAYSSDQTLKNKAIYENARKYSDRIFWNIPTSVSGDTIDMFTMSGSQFIGALLAPNTNLEAHSGGLNGNAVLKSVNVIGNSGFEFHNTGFNFESPEVKKEYKLSLALTNKYNGKPNEVSVPIEGMKTLTGRDLAGEDFEFVLWNDDTNTEVMRVTNDRDGKFIFDLKYSDISDPSKTDTYRYTINEVDTKQPHITYDNTRYQLIVSVSMDNGKLVAYAQVVDNQEITFDNTYDEIPSSIAVTLKGTKVFERGTLKGNDFKFELKDKETGTLVDTTTNSANGEFVFKTLTFDQPGIHHFTISEKTETAKQIIYDKEIYDVTIEVSENENNELVASTTIKGRYGSGNALVFTNTNVPPELPSTGNHPNYTGYVFLILGFSIVAIAYRKTREDV